MRSAFGSNVERPGTPLARQERDRSSVCNWFQDSTNDGMSVLPVTAAYGPLVGATATLLTSVIARIQALTVAGQWPDPKHAGEPTGLLP